MPDTTPGIYFNADNVCNYCLEKYPHYNPKGSDQLTQFLDFLPKQRGSNADCLVGLSGGKDSTYALIKLKEEYKKKIEAFTYVHEGSSDFSIQNAINICKKLKIKHHIVSLSKKKHLNTFKGFFKAWLTSPSTVTAGMTCVACKHLHVEGFEIARKRNIPCVVWSTSPLEYSPFLAIKHKGSPNNQFARESNNKGAKLLIREIFSSVQFPTTFIKYFSTCLKGCLAAFPNSPYLLRKYPEIRTLMFYEYEDWNPIKIKKYVQQYDWDIPINVQEDWHSDCLFNTFKEYMFQSELGVSYTDAFLSNQIRYGIITREEGIKKLKASKIHYAKEILKTMKALGMNDLIGEIDTSCFEVWE